MVRPGSESNRCRSSLRLVAGRFVFFLGIFFSIIFLHGNSAKCFAEGPQLLLNSAAAEHVAKSSNASRPNGRAKRIPAQITQSDAVKDAADLDSVHEIIREQGTTGGIFSPYRSPFYLSYVYDVVPIPDFEDWNSRAETEKLLLYQSTLTLSKLVIGSGLEPIYRDIVSSLRQFRDYTTLKVSPEQDGGVEVVSGQSVEKPLMELKLHISANEGIEPRVTIGGAATLRYDVIDDDVLLEYRHDF